ncbi:hypothetical protein GCM10009504_08480 [Pseudomonas laurentiana]|nr:hypothetical protein [Pseudomonas laurentiana]GGU53910.1 hypothetical protein GCM10009504_08480 [Pseudomonas laurentiana]
MSKVIVTFEKNWRGYAAGETAGFDSSVADSLIEAGYAIEADKKASKKGKTGANSNAPSAAQSSAGADESDTGDKPGAKSDADGKP